MNVLQNIIYQKVSQKFKYLNGKVAFSICQTWRMQQRKHRMGQTAYHAGQWTKEETRQSRLSAFNADAMDGVKGGVSYPPNLADAKRGNTERANGIPCRTTNERRKGAEPMSEYYSDAMDKERVVRQDVIIYSHK